MEIHVDLRTCKAYANCMVEAPDFFDFDEETGKVKVLVETVDGPAIDEVRRAVAACPVQAITVTE
jgi:ferredoxin